jgi:hypothetical protein
MSCAVPFEGVLHPHVGEAVALLADERENGTA